MPDLLNKELLILNEFQKQGSHLSTTQPEEPTKLLGRTHFRLVPFNFILFFHTFFHTYFSSVRPSAKTISMHNHNYKSSLAYSPRTYRQAATWRALQLITSFISAANTLATRRETTRIQLNAEKKIETEGPRVESLNKRLSMTHDKITTLEQMMCKISKGHQLLPPEIRHVVRALEYEHLIAKESNGSQPGAKGFSCYEHGTINIAYRWGNFICVGVDSKLSNSLTGDVTNLNYNKFYQISRNIYITMAGLRMAWEDMYQLITSVFSTIPEESHRVEQAANLAYQFVSPYGTVCSLVLGWDITSPHPQMFRVIAGESFTTSDSAMALGTGKEYWVLNGPECFVRLQLHHLFVSPEDSAQDRKSASRGRSSPNG
ncbi:hypothetical protein D8674_005026 [Pyrus ussuriensis x Pyrus communis]|uniref:STAG domain-containing protein n=1 Tax=Pyrus ussuriensis x Pyrus communis TaxID=2448454 RepID=A0A5N5FQ91_9ROSA|nr:hypothetical protein D8674_005026 [Pyrus ussuriensis x Pyrus communis]